MSLPQPPEPVLLVIAVLASPEVPQGEILAAVEEVFGPVGEKSPYEPFTFTGYYEREMGGGLMRGFWAMEKPVDQASLGALKLLSNNLEQRWAENGRRKVNLDPGTLDLGQFVLASCKPAAHRVAIGGGVWAEIEYLYQCGTFRPLEWTYPDYRDGETIRFFNGLRAAYKLSRRKGL